MAIKIMLIYCFDLYLIVFSFAAQIYFPTFIFNNNLNEICSFRKWKILEVAYALLVDISAFVLSVLLSFFFRITKDERHPL